MIRLPSAMDNRPLKFDEFESYKFQTIYVSATPGPYELDKSSSVIEQLIRRKLSRLILLLILDLPLVKLRMYYLKYIK